jgi:snapalysin
MPNKILSSLAILATAALGATAFAAAPANAAPAPERVQATTVSTYAGSPAEAAANKAFYDAVMKSALAKQAKSGNKLAAVTVRYRNNAPSFSSQISRSTQIWNSSVTNVRLVQVSSGAAYDFYYREGNDSRGSYASTNGHGRGYIFLDYRQAQQYDPTRITAHETGHVLGLPDHYSGPCSELMSGGGPGTSCTNPNPNATERNRVNQLWANGLTGLSTFKTIR